jgi:hypothetical protein
VLWVKLDTGTRLLTKTDPGASIEREENKGVSDTCVGGHRGTYQDQNQELRQDV